MTAALPVAAVERVRVRENVAACLAILGAEADPFRRFWNSCDGAARRVLLLGARLPELWAARGWDELNAEHRREIKRRAAALKAWLNEAVPV